MTTTPTPASQQSPARSDTKICRKPDGCTDQWKCSSDRVGDCGAQNEVVPARSDKDADRANLQGEKIFEVAAPYFAWNAASWQKATQGTIGMPGLLEYTKAAILADRAAKAQESAPSGESIATWQERYEAEGHAESGEFYMQAEITDLRAALARRATAGTTAAPSSETANVITGFTEWMRDTSAYPHNDDSRKPFDAFDAGAAWARRATAGNAGAADKN